MLPKNFNINNAYYVLGVGFYVIVSPEWLKLGSPPPELFIDKLMRYVGRPYYVALHQAAYLHGAKHLATSDFQVITDKRMPIIKTGQSRIVFFYRKNINNIERGLDNSQTHARFLKISSPELTALELLSYPRAVGSIENIATILAELGPKIKARKLADLSEEFSKPNVQRLGYLFERLGFANCVRVMKVKLFKSEVNWTELITNETVSYNTKSKQVELNKNWRIVIRFELRFDH